MTFYDDPNREAVGQPPIWAGSVSDEPATPESEPEEPEPEEPEPDDA
jgi:hypothetical protein